MATVLIIQYFFNFMKVPVSERGGTIFTLFVTFQLFNAFNCRQMGSLSVLSGVGKNKIMLLTFSATFILQVIILTFFPQIFGVFPLSLITWVKTVGVAFTVIFISELYKLIYRENKRKKPVNL